jgi:hypothetical protein
MSTWLLLAIIAAAFVLFFVWANRRYKQNRTNASGGPDSVADQHRRTGGASASGGQ